MEDRDVVGLLQLAARYRVSRLISWCELLLMIEVDHCVGQNVKKSDVDVIGLLLQSQVCDASWL